MRKILRNVRTARPKYNGCVRQHDTVIAARLYATHAKRAHLSFQPFEMTLLIFASRRFPSICVPTNAVTPPSVYAAQRAAVYLRSVFVLSPAAREACR